MFLNTFLAGTRNVFSSRKVSSSSTLIGQAHMKHRLPSIFKNLCKNIYSTNMENSDNGIYLLSAALCSFLSLDDM